jgi:hypothetical protein
VANDIQEQIPTHRITNKIHWAPFRLSEADEGEMPHYASLSVEHAQDCRASVINIHDLFSVADIIISLPVILNDAIRSSTGIVSWMSDSWG